TETEARRFSPEESYCLLLVAIRQAHRRRHAISSSSPPPGTRALSAARAASASHSSATGEYAARVLAPARAGRVKRAGERAWSCRGPMIRIRARIHKLAASRAPAPKSRDNRALLPLSARPASAPTTFVATRRAPGLANSASRRPAPAPP